MKYLKLLFPRICVLPIYKSGEKESSMFVFNTFRIENLLFNRQKYNYFPDQDIPIHEQQMIKTIVTLLKINRFDRCVTRLNAKEKKKTNRVVSMFFNRAKAWNTKGVCTVTFVETSSGQGPRRQPWQ